MENTRLGNVLDVFAQDKEYRNRMKNEVLFI